MPPSTVEYLLEKTRQKLTGDVKFLKRLLYFFELRVPAEVAVGGVIKEFLFPLVIPPSSYSMVEPFTVEATPTQEGGLIVEENGINQRTIKIQGNTGFKPRYFRGSALSVATLPAESKSYTRSLPQFALDKISGHRHFQYLQDAVFRTYADLKRDPALAPDTVLIFHNPQDDEHWLVKPQSFTLDRTRPNFYDYAIELLVVDKAEVVDKDFSEDKDLFDKIKDVVDKIKRAIDMVEGALNDIQALIGEIKAFIQGIESIRDRVLNIMERAKEFVRGSVDYIETPLGLVIDVVEDIEFGLAQLAILEETTLLATALIPDKTVQDLRTIQDGLETIAGYPEVFETEARKQLREFKNRQELITNVSKSRREEAEASDPPDSLDAVRSLGTTITPGEAQVGKADLEIGRQVKQYTGSREYALAQGDTLVNLAARFLGDARLWQHIAVLNGLRPPFVDEQAGADLTSREESPFPGAVGPGKTIRVPNYTKPPTALPLLPVLGVRLDAPTPEHMLGADLAMEPRSDGKGWDIPVDTEHGSVDAKVVRGVDNLKQVVIARLSTEKGTDMLYKKVGIQRMVGSNSAFVDFEIARFCTLAALTADPRIANVVAMEFDTTEDGDGLTIDANLVPRGFSQGVNVKTSLPE